MQRWFFLEKPKKLQSKPEKKMSAPAPEQPLEQPTGVLSQQWTFTVSAPNLTLAERVYITGSTYELGEWNLKRIVLLHQDPDTGTWSKSITIPNTCEIFYRYLICVQLEDTNELTVNWWEVHIQPRVITENMLHPTLDQFGEYNGEKKVSKGWLIAQTLIQFKFTKNPLILKKSKTGRNMHIKITPVNLSLGNEIDIANESSSADVTDSHVPRGVKVEVSTLDNNPALCSLKLQKQFGREYRPNDILLINVLAPKPKDIAFLLDLYCYSSRASSEDPPCHVGYVYILPNMFRPSEGCLQLPVTCNIKHRPLGTICFEYMIVNPMMEDLNDLQVSYAKHWNPIWTGLEVGHRGLGASFKTKEGSSIRENTIASLKKAAASGADLLEFDVQLSKDMIPVVYHDYHIYISMKRKKEIAFCDMLQLPVKDLTLEQLQKLKVYHLVELDHEVEFTDDDQEEHQPFPTLEQCLKDLTEHVGFNIELKWNMQLEDGTVELENPFDMNVYVDKVLEVVLKYAGQRRIVLSCFNPDICTMARNKQNKYPVMFLTQGVTNKYKPYRDPRCVSIPAAVQSAISSDILGVVVHTEDLLRDPSQVRLATDAGLVIFCWGDDNNNKDTIQKLKKMGLHAVIYDKLDEYTVKEVKESIFLVEARESQKGLLRAASQENDAASAGASSASASFLPPPRPYLDLSVRHKIQDVSTVTSLASLASSIDTREQLSNLKRITKESQVKEQPNMFGNVNPGGDTNQLYCNKKSRNN